MQEDLVPITFGLLISKDKMRESDSEIMIVSYNDTYFPSM